MPGLEQKIIGLASGSQRRKKALLQLKELAPIDIVPTLGGDEDQTRELAEIVLAKIAFAYPTLVQLCSKQQRQLDAVIAADTGTRPIIDSRSDGGKILGKPNNLKEIKNVFSALSANAHQYGQARYQVISSSALQDASGATSDTLVANIVLDTDKVRELSSQKGFSEYIQEFNTFYSSKMYSQAMNNSSVTPKDLSGGLSLPVLTKMGVVTNIDGVFLDTSKTSRHDMKSVFKAALLTVAVGFSPNVINRIHPDAMTTLLQWNWVNEVTDKSLSGVV